MSFLSLILFIVARWINPLPSDGRDGTEGDLDLLLLHAVSVGPVVGAAAHVPHAVPHGGVQQEVEERADGVVAQLPQQRDGAQIQLENRFEVVQT